MRIAFLGPAPTFAERATRVMRPHATLVAAHDIPAQFAALASGQVDAIVVPFENSAIGRVSATLEALGALAEPLVVEDEHVEMVRFSLYRRAGDGVPLGRVLGHPAALAQCKRWIGRHHAAPVAEDSNGAAFAAIAASGRPGGGALAPPGCGTAEMVEVAQNCQGPKPNQTRFLLIGAEAPASAARALVGSPGSGAIELCFPAPVAVRDFPGRPLLLWSDVAPTGTRIGWPSATSHVWRMDSAGD